MHRRAPVLVTVALLLASLTFYSCNVMKELGQAVTNLSRCTFKLDGISDFQIAGISLAGKTKLNIADAANAIAAFGRGELPTSFTLNVAATNPNDGTGGTNKSAATMTGFAWNLLIDNTQTISGDIAEPIVIPGTGQQSIIPLRMNLDLLKFFKDKGYEKIIDLALALGGAQGSASRVTLRAKPSIKTDYGTITYPNEIDIVNTEFRGK